MNILILRVSAIGDVVHTLPAIFLLKKLYPKAKISWVVQQKAASLLKNQPFLENVWVLPDKFLKPKNWSETFKIIKEIRKTKWDAILDFQGILKTSALLLLLKGEKYSFCTNHARSSHTTFATKHHITPTYTNIIEKNLSLAGNMTLKKHAQKKRIFNSKYQYCSPTLDNLKKDFFLDFQQKTKIFIDDWLKENNISKFIAITPNTTWESKQWPKENWTKLLKLLDKSKRSKHKIILFGKHFGEPGQSIAKFCQEHNIEVYPPPKIDLISTAYLISKSDLLIGPDTGLLHLADFLNIKTIAIFGPTTAQKHGPFLKEENIANAIQIPCLHRQEKIHGDGSKEQNCMYQLKPEKLLERILKIINP